MGRAGEGRVMEGGGGKVERDPHFLLFGARPGEFRPRGLWVFAAVYCGAFAAAGLMAPLIHAGVQSLAAGAGEGSVWGWLAEQKFTRYVDRVRLIFSLGALVWMIRAWGLWGRFGFRWDGRGWRDFGFGLVAGLVSLGAAVVIQALAVPLEAREGRSVVVVVGTALGSGVVIGFLEEALFRGLLLRLFYTAMRPRWALIASAAVYAAVHFKTVRWQPEGAVGWTDGLVVAWRSFLAVWYEFDGLVFLNLFLAGLLLGCLFLRKRSLMLCWGVHAGWVGVRNSAMRLYDVPEAGEVFGSEKLTNGLLASVILLLLLGVVMAYGKHDRAAKS